MKNYLKLLIPLVFILNLTTDVMSRVVQMGENGAIVLEVDKLQDIKQKGVLIVLSPNEEPYSYKDPKGGIFSGLDADIIREVAKRLGAKDVSVRYIQFPNALEELVKNPNVDLFAQGIYITDERKKLVNFTDPIYTEKDVILTRQDLGVNCKEDLKNRTIGVIGGSVFASMSQSWKQQGLIKDYITFFDYNSLQIALENGIVDALLTDSIAAENSLLMKPKSKLKILSPSKYKSELSLGVGYALKKEDVALLNAINQKLQEMKKDGILYEILARYGSAAHYIP